MSSLVKGTAVIGFKKGIDHVNGKGYFDKAMIQFDSDWKEMIMASSWYNAENLMQVVYFAAQESKGNKKEFCISLAENVLENDLNGVYKFFIKIGGSEKVLSFFPQLASTYASFQHEKIIENRKGYFKAVVEVPSNLSEFSVYNHEGALKGILKVCGNPMKSFAIISTEKIMKNNIEVSLLTFEATY